MKIKYISTLLCVAATISLLFGCSSKSSNGGGSSGNLTVTGYGDCVQQDVAWALKHQSGEYYPFEINWLDDQGTHDATFGSSGNSMKFQAPENKLIHINYHGKFCATPPIFTPSTFTIPKGGSITITVDTKGQLKLASLHIKTMSSDPHARYIQVHANLSVEHHNVSATIPAPLHVSLRDNYPAQIIKLTRQGDYNLSVTPTIDMDNNKAQYPHTVHSDPHKTIKIEYLPTTNRLIGQITLSPLGNNLAQDLITKGFNVIEMGGTRVKLPAAIQTAIEHQQELIQNANETGRAISLLLSQKMTINTTVQQLLFYYHSNKMNGFIFQLSSYSPDLIAHASKVITQLRQQYPQVIIGIQLSASLAEQITSQVMIPLKHALFDKTTSTVPASGWFQIPLQSSSAVYQRLLHAGIISQHVVMEAAPKAKMSDVLQQYKRLNPSVLKGLMIAPNMVTDDAQLKAMVFVSTSKFHPDPLHR